MMRDWLENLQSATKGIVEIAYMLDVKASGCYIVGMDLLADDLFNASQELAQIADLVEQGASGAAQEICDAAAHEQLVASIVAVFAACEMEEKEAGD
jgi:hypothetical protein